jgi:hypothetical protein
MKKNETVSIGPSSGRHVIIVAKAPKDDPGSTLVTRYVCRLFEGAGLPAKASAEYRDFRAAEAWALITLSK